MVNIAMKFLLALTAVCWLTSEPVAAKERPWFKYENAYFEAYSDAPEKKVRKLLDELENFRAAVAQVVNIKIPDGVVKTQVVIFRSSGDFRDVTDKGLADAFAMGIRGVPYVVMPVGGSGEWSKIAIRHEYTHVLLGYSEHRFPQWYQEGFAEFMSGTTFRKGGAQFTLGESIGRPRTQAPWVPWSELMSGSFDFHAVDFSLKLSNAYLQSWLLVHYLTLGDEFKYNEDLGRYLGLFSASAKSDVAIEQVFGMTPSALGNVVLKEYGRKSPYYLIDYKPGVQDHDFQKTDADIDEVNVTIDEIHEQYASQTE